MSRFSFYRRLMGGTWYLNLYWDHRRHTRVLRWERMGIYKGNHWAKTIKEEKF